MKSSKSAITGLTTNEEAFTQLLAKGQDSYTSHCTVFGVGTAKRKSKVEMATRLAKKVNVAAYLERLKEEARARGVIDRDEIMGWLRTIATVGMEREQVRKVKITKTRDRGTNEILETEREEIEYLEKLVDSSGANSAIDKMIKMGGLYAAEKTETEVKVKGRFVLNLKDRTD